MAEETLWFEFDFEEDGTLWRAYHEGVGCGKAERAFKEAHPRIRSYRVGRTSRPIEQIKALPSRWEERTALPTESEEPKE